MAPLPIRVSNTPFPTVHWIAKQPGKEGLMIPLRRNITLAMVEITVTFMNQYFNLFLGRNEATNQFEDGLKRYVEEP